MAHAKSKLTPLGERRTVVRYDERGCGLSDPDPGDVSLETGVGDLLAVADAAGLDRFALPGLWGMGPVRPPAQRPLPPQVPLLAHVVVVPGALVVTNAAAALPGRVAVRLVPPRSPDRVTPSDR